MRHRSVAVSAPQPPARAARALATAASISCAVPRPISPTMAPVDGSSTGNVPPLPVLRHSPLMKTCLLSSPNADCSSSATACSTAVTAISVLPVAWVQPSPAARPSLYYPDNITALNVQVEQTHLGRPNLAPPVPAIASHHGVLQILRICSPAGRRLQSGALRDRRLHQF